ncbi:MAG: hypothetical protein DCC51_14765 [Anaerolineae bacterium]|nr:MAG: hypothetical protein DCC51_14765 [Anaerolineae bacterium]
MLQAVMDELEMESVTISVNGLREGLFFEHFWQHLVYPVVSDVRQFSVLNKARIYQYSKAHANQVRFLAGRLFKQLAPLHGYGRAEEELLDAAALLHDLGTLISYDDHHKHSQTLIINSGLPGFQPRETALIALMTRYHRKGRPRVDGFESLLVDGDETLLTQLSAILRRGRSDGQGLRPPGDHGEHGRPRRLARRLTVKSPKSRMQTNQIIRRLISSRSDRTA